MSTLRIRRVIAAAALVVGGLTGACSEPTSTDGVNAPPTEAPTTPTPAGALRVAPDTVTMVPGDSMYFVAVDSLASGSRGAATVAWSASGGTVDSAGLFRAPSQPGSYRVIARGANGADSALVVVGAGLDTSATPVTGTDSTASALLSGLQLDALPATLGLAPGGKQQFTAVARYAGRTYSIQASWLASGGTITSGGYFTAPTSSGSYRVIARLVIASYGISLADTSIVTVGSGTTTPPTTPTPTLSSVVLTPATASLALGATQQFTAQGRMSDGSATSVSVTWGATGGTVTPGGLYTAGGTAGTFRVIAVQQGGTRADTSAVTVTASAPTLTAVEVTPASASVATGATQQFSALGRMSDNSTSSVTVTWSATGGAITPGGLYTAGTTAGAYRVIAVQQGGTRADTSAVTVTSTPPASGTVANPGALPAASGQLKNVAAYTALNVRGMAAGSSYTDPVTGVRVWKVTSATCADVEQFERALVLGGPGAGEPGVGAGEVDVVHPDGQRVPGGLHAGRGVLQLAASALGDEDADVLEEPGDAAARVRGGGEPVAAVRHGDQHVRRYRVVPGGLQHRRLAAAGQG